MACQEFTVLYTHQKTKKSKVWQDGVLKTTVGGNKATLFDDKGQILDSIFVKFQVKPEDDLESERYLITVEAEMDPNDQPKSANIPVSTRNHLKSSDSSSLCPPAGLKRKFTGFQRPRQVEKRRIMEEQIGTVSSTSKIPPSYFPSQFYASPPLFSITNKKEERHLLPSFNGNAFVESSRGSDSVAPVAFISLDDHKMIQSQNHSTGSADAEYLKQDYQLGNGLVNSNYYSTNGMAVSPSTRSKAQIIALLKSETPLLSQKQYSEPSKDETASSLTLPLMESESNLECLPLSEPSKSTDLLFKQELGPVSGSTSSAYKEITTALKPLNTSEKPSQTKSRWDIYLPSCSVEVSSDLDRDLKHSNKHTSGLPPVKKDLKENGADRGRYNENHKRIPQLPISSKIALSPMSGNSVKTQSHSISNAGLSSVSNNVSNCINAMTAFEADISTSKTHNLEIMSENESSSVTNSESFSNGSVGGDLVELDKQFTEVNFNLMDMLDFSDTEDGEHHANSTQFQSKVCLKERTEAQLEVSVQNHKVNKGKDNMQSGLLKERNNNCISGFLPLQLCDKKDHTNMEEKESSPDFVSELRHSEATTVYEMVEANAVSIHEDLGCVERNFLMVNDDEYQPSKNQLQKTNTVTCVSATSNTLFMEENNKKGLENGIDSSQLSSMGICNNRRPANPLLAYTEKDSSSVGFPQYISNKLTAQEEMYDLASKPVSHSLNCETPSDETQMSKNEVENVVGILRSVHDPSELKKRDFICVKPLAVDFSSLPELANGFNMLRSLTEHSTALESLQMFEDTSDTLCQRETLREKHESVGGPAAKQTLAEVPYSEAMQIPCLYSGAPKMHSSTNVDIEKSTAALPKLSHEQRPFGVTDSQPKPVEFQGYQVKGSAASEVMMRELSPHPRTESESIARDSSFFSVREPSSPGLTGFSKPLGPRTLSEEDLSNIGIKDFHKEVNFIEDEASSELCLCSQAPAWITRHSPLDLNLNAVQYALPHELNQRSGYNFSPSPNNKESMEEQELLVSTCIPESAESFFSLEGSCSPAGNDKMSVRLSALKARTPVVTVPVDDGLLDSQVYSDVSACEHVQQHFAIPVPSVYEKSKMPEPEDRMCETHVDEKCVGGKQGVLSQSAFPNVPEQKRQSKWQKYQNTTPCDLRTPNSSVVAMTDDFRAESVLGMQLDDTGESQRDAINRNPPDFMHLQTVNNVLCKQQRNFSSQDSVSEGKTLSLHLSQIFSTEETRKVLGQLNCHNISRHTKRDSELFFPSMEMVNSANIPKRQMYIPTEFKSPAHYKQVFTTALMEHLNIMLFELSQKLHKALGKADISFYTSAKGEQGQTQENSAPLCNHEVATKLVTVKKEGRNKGRLFYACDAPKSDRCDFFKWLDDVNPGQTASRPRVVLHDTKSIATHLRCQNISIYEDCHLLVRKMCDIQRKCSKLKKFNIADISFDCDSKSKLYLKLNRKEHSSVYSKDDLWVVSKTLTFDPLDTFIACSVFFGPSSSNEVELVALKGFSPSNWRSNAIVHALLVCNASTELTTLRNIEDDFNPGTLPIMQHLLARPSKQVPSSCRVNNKKFKPPVLNTNTVNCGLPNPEMTISLANKMIQTFNLNKDQAAALIQIGSMMASYQADTEMEKQPAPPITIIHGVFGSGKSYLLAIVILFLVQIFETSEATDIKRPAPWKVLISSSTNVAVDRVLLCLLDLGFEEFIRVGSVRKIAKPILPFSLHAGLGSESDQLKELLALLKENLSPAEKNYVRKTIEQHKLGNNKARLKQVRVVAATCAACPFPCMKNLRFPFVVLDECSQMTEPASLLPIARFECEKLILVGDPKQLPPTIQGSANAHSSNGLEQTLFDRLSLMLFQPVAGLCRRTLGLILEKIYRHMTNVQLVLLSPVDFLEDSHKQNIRFLAASVQDTGHEPVLLRTQYRCHPAISAVARDLFYEGNLLNGISERERNPLVDWLPTLCFYNANGLEQVERDYSFYNMAESFFAVKLIQAMIASGIEGAMIGVITLYKSQMSKISNLLGAVHSDTSQIKNVQVSTVDAFQGAEKEIIVLSCVRTRQVGFIDSEKRVNVALTRGKRHLLIVGNLNCLRKNSLWGRVIQHCAGRKHGLQNVSQCEQQLNDILLSYLEKKEEELKNAK